MIPESMMEAMAPNTMALAREISAKAEQDPSKAQALQSLTAAMKAQAGNFSGVAALETLLGKDAAFKNDVRNLALQNPAALEKILPQALANPDGMKSLVAQTAAASLAARPAAAAPTIQSAVAPKPQAAPQATPVGVLAQTPAAAPTPAAQSTPEPASAPAAESVVQPGAAAPVATGMSDLQKMAELQKTPGYDDLMARIEKNDDLGAMFDSLMNGSKDDPQARSKALDDILRQTRKNPNMLTDLVKTIDEKPGVVSSIAGMAANDPKMAMTALGMYSQFNQGFGKLLDGLFGPGVLDKLLVSLMGSVAPMLSNSNALMLTSNNGGSLTQKAMQILGGAPAEVNVVSPENGAVNTQTGAQFQQGAAERNTAGTPDPAEQDKNRAVAAVMPMTGPQPSSMLG